MHSEPAPPKDPIRIPSGWLLFVLLLLVAFAVIRGTGKPPRLAANCVTPGLRLYTKKAVSGQRVGFTAVGPDTGDYVVALGARSAVRSAGGALSFEPAEGTPPAGPGAASRVLRLAGCRATATFRAEVPAGDRTVTLFRIEGGRGKPVATRQLLVLPAKR